MEKGGAQTLTEPNLGRKIIIFRSQLLLLALDARRVHRKP